MKKIFFPLLLTLTITSCSSPKLKEVNFKPYGKSMDATIFRDRFEDRLDIFLKEYFVDPDSSLYSSKLKTGVIIESTYSSKEEYVSDESSSDNYANYYDATSHTQIDSDNSRYLYNATTKSYLTGKLEEGSVPRNIVNKNVYGEIKDDQYYKADLDTKEVTGPLNTSNFYIDSLSTFIGIYYIYSAYTYSYDQGNCYINGDTYTYAYRKDKDNEIIFQTTFNNSLSIKGKIKTTDKNNGTVSSLAYISFDMKRSGSSIKKHNYEGYDEPSSTTTNSSDLPW